MIKAMIMDPSRNRLKTICFTDSSGGCSRIAYFDKNNVPVLEKITELHMDKVGIQSQSILVGPDYKLVAYKKYLRNSENKVIATEDYKLVDDDFQLINRCVTEIYGPNHSITRKEIWYDPNNNPRYMWVEEDGDYKFYTPEGKEIDGESYVEYLTENHSDFETLDDIEQQILKSVLEKV
ncbi:hypothetical protein MMP66_05665 [Acinetobacter dispersus]|uniref:hypothetical protein n=1 Tax=Acinetobacter dispersus TaxID=70348 RepID=UPI001F4B37FF|nr:hypothetical protein [Acinetobacter dispersus]MCH7393767.1 hypothetical protein [Acinetobacter dispersus]